MVLVKPDNLVEQVELGAAIQEIVTEHGTPRGRIGRKDKKVDRKWSNSESVSV